MSTVSEEGVMKVKTEACDRLLEQRVEVKLKNSKKMGDIINRLNVAVPKPRDSKERPPFIPEAALKKKCASVKFFWIYLVFNVLSAGYDILLILVMKKG